MSTFEIGEADFLLDGTPYRRLSGAIQSLRCGEMTVHPPLRLPEGVVDTWEFDIPVNPSTSGGSEPFLSHTANRAPDIIPVRR